MRKFKAALAIAVLVLFSFSTYAQAAFVDGWSSAYLQYLQLNYVPQTHFFLADCSKDGIPELYYSTSTGKKTTVRMANYINGKVIQMGGSLTVTGKMFVNLLRDKKSSNCVWEIVGYDGNEEMTSDGANIEHIELRASSTGISSVSLFRKTAKNEYYYKGRKVSRSYYDKKMSDRYGALDFVNFYSGAGDSSSVRCDLANLQAEYQNYVNSYLSAFRSMYPITDVALKRTKITLSIGKTYALKAGIKPSFAVDKDVTWSSSDASVVSVSNGLITAVKPGVAYISASTNGKTASCMVTVPVPKVKKITINGVSMPVGSSITLTATVSPAYARNAVK